jgi:broad specificity phosphatase PhoE|tara:strand:+ start:72 stop:632 length:561 start_codon:yes stop_codon:yes gene_type:complete
MKKKVFLIRHGQSEANASTDLDNPTNYYDTILTPLGKEQALLARSKLEKINFDLMICSPLTRTLQTFSLIFPNPISNTIIFPLAREHLDHSCDVGRHPEELKKDFPNFDFSTLQKFWWNNNQVIDEKEINHESINELDVRVHQFKEWITLREENTIAVVSHGTFISRIINFFLDNCEFEIWHPTDD